MRVRQTHAPSFLLIEIVQSSSRIKLAKLNIINSWSAKDVFSSTIQYFPGDYRPVSGIDSNNAVPLYNGNISALTTGLYHCDETLLKLFRYDKLNRIKRMRTASRWFWDYGWSSVSDNFSTTYTYDWNGNLLSLRRKNENGQLMHDINYWYLDSTKNRLDSITAAGILPSRYQYDALGNLVHDKAEGLTVGWNAMGKVDSICRNGNLLSRFRYSPTGQRQMKMAGGDTIFYIHNATGNVMCVYRLQDDTLKATERYLYGSKRLGMLGHQVWITATKSGFHDLNTIGTRTYELTDHLGNVTATLFDRKELYYDDNDGLVYSKPVVSTYTDYYPFGYPINDRSYDYGGYRYFFNGQEADNEVLGEGALTEFGGFGYDTRIARRWNLDPIFLDGYSPYVVFLDNPIGYVDDDGESPISFFAKRVAKKGLKKAATEFIQSAIKSRLSAYMSKKWAKQLAQDALDAVSLATSQSWWEVALEFVPVIGDAYSAAQLGKQGYHTWKIVHKFEGVMEWASKAAEKAWKPLGSNTLKADSRLSKYVSKLNRQGDNLRESDLAGAVKEIYGLESGVKSTGNSYQHLNKVKEALSGMKNELKKLRNDIYSGTFKGEELEQAQGILKATEEQYNSIVNTLNSARKASVN